ncbi:MAG: ABC transporter ATP-binding protein [Actinomycetota bacterium]|nr:ABC transporter ATP-binding protein [Actinomycetota bacterium]
MVKMVRARTPEHVAGSTLAPRIEVASLTKRFGNKVAVDAVDLAVDPGTFLVLLGPSGSGKSTLLRCLAGIERATAGCIRLGAVEVDGPGGHLPPERRDLAMVFQDYALWPHLTAEQNVAFALKRCRLSPDERRRQARSMLDHVGLAALHERYPGQLSGGEQQRVALARALAGRPGLLLFDEPLSNLDADRRERLRIDIGAMVREQGATAVYITHDQAEAFALADVIGVLESGRLVQIGQPEDVYRNPADAFVARFTGLAGELAGRVAADGADAPPFGNGSACGGPPGVVLVDIGGFVVRGRPVGRRDLQPGQPVRILVRPSALRFSGPSATQGPGATPHVAAQPGPWAEVPAIVRDAAFRGWGYEHVIEVAGGHRLAGVPADRRLPVAAVSSVTLAVDGCLVVDDDDARPPGAAVTAIRPTGTEIRSSVDALAEPSWDPVPA